MAAPKWTVEQVLDQLHATPVQLRKVARGVSPELLRRPPGPDAWSANDVLAHLRACADKWGDCATRIVQEDQPQLRGTEPRVWITKTDYPDLEFAASLRAFVRQRTALLAVLDELRPDEWRRTGTLVGTHTERALDDLVPRWIAGAWPFRSPRYIGVGPHRDLTFADRLAPPDVDKD